jgi:hypothetical protein
MKVFCYLFVAIALTTGSVNSAHATNAWPSVTFSSYWANQYLAFGGGAVLYDKPVVQSDLYVSFDNGLYLDLWSSTSLDTKWNNNLGDEVDYGIGWEKTIRKYTVRIGFIYFDEPNVFTLGAGDIAYTHAKVSRPVYGITLCAGFENYITMPDSGFQGGNIFSVGLSKSVSLRKDKLSLGASAALAYDDGGFGLDNGLLGRGNISATWKLTKKLSFIAPSVSWYAPLTIDDSRKFDTVVSAGFSYKFN